MYLPTGKMIPCRQDREEKQVLDTTSASKVLCNSPLGGGAPAGSFRLHRTLYLRQPPPLPLFMFARMSAVRLSMHRAFECYEEEVCVCVGGGGARAQPYPIEASSSSKRTTFRLAESSTMTELLASLFAAGQKTRLRKYCGKSTTAGPSQSNSVPRYQFLHRFCV